MLSVVPEDRSLSFPFSSTRWECAEPQLTKVAMREAMSAELKASELNN